MRRIVELCLLDVGQVADFIAEAFPVLAVAAEDEVPLRVQFGGATTRRVIT